jgi:phage replication O-like protein O
MYGMEKRNGKKFQGFRSPKYTQIPDELLDELMPVLSGAELKVLLYICRRTFGFKKESDTISLSQIGSGITTKDGKVLDGGTGLSKDSVSRAVKSLEELGVIVRNRSRSKERGDEPTSYCLNMLDTPVSENLTPRGGKIGYGGVRKSGTQQTVRQETDIQHNVNVGLIKNENENDLLENERATILVSDLMEQLHDRNPRSKGTFRKIVTALGTDRANQLLGNTIEANKDGLVSRSKMAGYFIGMAKNVAKEAGIDLGFKTENGKPTNGSQSNHQNPVNGLVAELAHMKSWPS